MTILCLCWKLWGRDLRKRPNRSVFDDAKVYVCWPDLDPKRRLITTAGVTSDLEIPLDPVGFYECLMNGTIEGHQHCELIIVLWSPSIWFIGNRRRKYDTTLQLSKSCQIQDHSFCRAAQIRVEFNRTFPTPKQELDPLYDVTWPLLYSACTTRLHNTVRNAARKKRVKSKKIEANR